MSRVLILCPDHVGLNMAGPAIRYVEIAQALSAYHEVTLGVLNETDYRIENVAIVRYANTNIDALLADHDVVLISGYQLTSFPALTEADIFIVADIYNPFALENLEIAERRKNYDFESSVQNDVLRVGDFFICASERQRDFWLGMLAALHRLEPEIYLIDRSFKNLIDVVTFGIPSKKPVHEKRVLKGAYPGIEPEDFVLIWAGGLYNWLDADSLINAMAVVGKTRKDVKLFFMGTKHPNALIPEMEASKRAKALAESLELSGQTVFFNDWVPYGERQNYLIEADLGISLHPNHLETRFSFRTRVLDYIWASLPTLITEGDAMADIVGQNKLGQVVGYGDVDGIASAILELANNPQGLIEIRDNFSTIQEDFYWDRVIEPLKRYCDSPKKINKDITEDDVKEDEVPKLKHLEKLVIDKERHIANLEVQLDRYSASLTCRGILSIKRRFAATFSKEKTNV